MKSPGFGISIRLAVSFGILLLFILALMTVAALQAGGFDSPQAFLILAVGLPALATGAGLAVWNHRAVSRPLHDVIAVARRMAGGDLSEPVACTAHGELRALQEALQQINERTFRIVAEVRTGTAAIATTTGQISGDNASLSSRTESQASSLEETASSMEELTSTVRNNADNARQANALVATASRSAVKGHAVVGQVVQTMVSIRDSSRKVADIISVIDGIAFQTNILALNAAVESARAGEQGRGFAVVAGEVRTLAQRSAAAAREIKDLITGSVQSVDTGGKLVDEAGVAMQEIVDSVRHAADLVNDIAAASAEQSAGLEEINQAVIQIDGMTQKNAALVEDISASAASLQEQAVTLTAAVSAYKLGARELGSAEEAVAMVRSAGEFARAQGARGIIDEVNKLNKGRFIDRDLYISIYGMDGKCLAHGANRRLIGVDGMVFKDLDGKLFIRDIVAAAKSKGAGWIEYKWAHPVTKATMVKSTYFERCGDLVLSCGTFSRSR